MWKRIVSAGVLAGIVLTVWAFVVNGLLGFQARIDMKRISSERQVYELLRESIPAPGRYACNPPLTPEGRFPEGQPVFSVLYGGMGHEAAGRLMLVGLASFFLAPLLGAWLLSHASAEVLKSLPRKVLFFTGIGLLIAMFSDLQAFGIGGYPARDALLIGANHVLAWTAAGLAAARPLRPQA